MKVLVTCPPMLTMIDDFIPLMKSYGMEVTAPKVIQTLTTQELIELVPEHDGWIIGDDPATKEVFLAGKNGRLKAAVKWGIGVDNVDFSACREYGIPITNTPNMFGAEVADLAVGYVIALARETFQIDAAVRVGNWPKPCGLSLAGRKVGVIGYGDIGKNITKRLIASGMVVCIYDPALNVTPNEMPELSFSSWPNGISELDFIVIACALTPSSYRLINTKVLKLMKPGVRLVNVGRGPIIDEAALCDALQSGIVYSAALDVFESEPLPMNSYLRIHPRCVLGSHNASNTTDAVRRTSNIAINKLMGFLSEGK